MNITNYYKLAKYRSKWESFSFPRDSRRPMEKPATYYSTSSELLWILL